ncbi:right-handed parallel beta-helix repeat-containing protein [Nocardioides immobilis]|uniref:Right-handed parallel beta-helix repeat-containing protein n=1 Tax=Nocardioides immobilis TaxID=2049295 RepID=A0A417Y442_9ACTN|nr:right-handed parallel beta-helix repeat-containing protein [Nocardioides immobilis]RHW27448.1 right-handed parallel beta-helix repeat-containing protein [Nocardioides immobilis]
MRRALPGVLVLLGLLALVLVAPPAGAHEERESEFPPGNGSVPVHRTESEAADVLVVCRPDSADRIARIGRDAVRTRNLRLLEQCAFSDLQAAVDAVEVARTNIYVLPGVYRERPSWDPDCVGDYDGGVVSYELSHSCGEVVNLVTIAGDDPEDDDIVCDSELCQLQIEGTGRKPGSVVFRGGFRPDGDWVKHNGIKADRADGFYLANMTLEQFRENAVYVHETDGYVIDRVVTRNNDLYGVLTFTSDHGLIQRCEAYHNGDSGIYPGSAADVNATNRKTGPLTRWSVEVRDCNMHHNALGFSGTAGNSVYVHDNLIHDNGIGFVVESILAGHPGMPQDHGWFSHNKIYSNNVNYYGNVTGEDAPCQEERPVDRGHQHGVVCPAFALPVGTGGMMVGNHNYVDSNHVWNNYRQGFMLFWVPPAILRDDYNPLHQTDNSNYNHFTRNKMGLTPTGEAAPNGLDFWWDDAGIGNCWQDNETPDGVKISHNATLGYLPNCKLPSLLPISNVIKTTSLLGCAQYDRYSNPSPNGCDWIVTPPKPTAESIAAASAGADQGPGPAVPVVLVALGLVGAAAVRFRSRRARGR